MADEINPKPIQSHEDFGVVRLSYSHPVDGIPSSEAFGTLEVIRTADTARPDSDARGPEWVADDDEARVWRV